MASRFRRVIVCVAFRFVLRYNCQGGDEHTPDMDISIRSKRRSTDIIDDFKHLGYDRLIIRGCSGLAESELYFNDDFRIGSLTLIVKSNLGNLRGIDFSPKLTYSDLKGHASTYQPNANPRLVHFREFLERQFRLHLLRGLPKIGDEITFTTAYHIRIQHNEDRYGFDQYKRYGEAASYWITGMILAWR